MDLFSKKWQMSNTKIVNFARYLIFEKKLPIFNYLPKSIMKSYVTSYFQMPDFQLTLKERNLLINYFLVISEMPPCGENSLWHIIDFGGYSDMPIIDIILKNREIDYFVYYGDGDYLDFEDAKKVCLQQGVKNFKILKDTKHQVFM